MPDSTLSRHSAALMGAWTRPPLLPKTHKFHTETAGEPYFCLPVFDHRHVLRAAPSHLPSFSAFEATPGPAVKLHYVAEIVIDRISSLALG